MTTQQPLDTAITVTDVTKKYKRFTLGPVTFELPRGYIMGLVGANGAGKTTLIKSLLGLVHPSSGNIHVLGEQVDARVGGPLKVGAVFDQVPYPGDRSVSSIAKYVATLDHSFDQKVWREAQENYQLNDHDDIKELSRGAGIKLQLAIAEARHTELLILDEPTAGLDPAARADLLEMLQNYIVAGDRSVLFSTHITHDVEAIADYVTVLINGRQVASAQTAEFIDQYRTVRGSDIAELGKSANQLIGVRQSDTSFEAIARTEDAEALVGCVIEPASLDAIIASLGRAEI